MREGAQRLDVAFVIVGMIEQRKAVVRGLVHRRVTRPLGGESGDVRESTV
jgi:hypothetical protein